MADRVERNKEVVSRLVERVINQWHIEELDDLFSPSGVDAARKDSPRSEKRSRTGRWNSRSS